MTLWLFPNVANCLYDLLADYGTCALEATPLDLADHLPYVLITDLGGSDDKRTDLSTVTVDVYTSDGRVAVVLLAEKIRQFLTGGPHVTDGAVLDRFDTITKPHLFPYGTPGIFRATATYRTAARRMPVADESSDSS